MTSELADYEKKLNNIKQEMSEEDIISSELENRLKKQKIYVDTVPYFSNLAWNTF